MDFGNIGQRRWERVRHRARLMIIAVSSRRAVCLGGAFPRGPLEAEDEGWMRGDGGRLRSVPIIEGRPRSVIA